jgi:hypothetical protein
MGLECPAEEGFEALVRFCGQGVNLLAGGKDDLPLFLVANSFGRELVVIEPFLSCGSCYPCRIGKPNCCADLQIIGVHRSGGYAECVLAPASNLRPVPEGVTPFMASFAEPITIGIHACRAP